MINNKLLTLKLIHRPKKRIKKSMFSFYGVWGVATIHCESRVYDAETRTKMGNMTSYVGMAVNISLVVIKV